ncbi:MAG: hypothetical protein DMG88_07745 [Acidobacteria bacterium]|nr:MAG: hypothetical protein DMG88_07745 [Acidobacteriota bacterium]
MVKSSTPTHNCIRFGETNLVYGIGCPDSATFGQLALMGIGTLHEKQENPAFGGGVALARRLHV